MDSFGHWYRSCLKTPSEPLFPLIFFSFFRLCLFSEKWALTESSNAFRDRTRLEAAWSLANIAGAESRSHSPLTMAIVADGALAPLIALLHMATNEELVYQALWAVGNIVADNGHFRNMALDKGLLNAVLPFLQDTTPISLLRILSWLVANVCRTRDPPPGVDLIETLLPKIVWMVNHEDHLVRNLSGDDAKHFRLIQREESLRIQEWRQESVFSDFFDGMYWRVTFFVFTLGQFGCCMESGLFVWWTSGNCRSSRPRWRCPPIDLRYSWLSSGKHQVHGTFFQIFLACF